MKTKKIKMTKAEMQTIKRASSIMKELGEILIKRSAYPYACDWTDSSDITNCMVCDTKEYFDLCVAMRKFQKSY